MKLNYYRSTAGAPLPSIADATGGSLSLATFSRFLALAGLEDLLREDKDFTLFAPTDAAFESLPPETLQALGDDPAKLRDLLAYHILSGTRERSAFANSKVKTMQGMLVSVGITDDGLTIDHANTCAHEIPCANGVIHPIDAVLIPGMKPAAQRGGESAWSGRRRVSKTRAAEPDNWPFVEPRTAQ
jgi:uncharacterized surface protein with fasciclin (FAS1) repeats